MKSQHTKGEWKVFELSKPEGFENKLRIVAPTLKESYVASIPTGPSVRKPYNESLANAKLIAAAPDLLKALIDVTNRFRGMSIHEFKNPKQFEALILADQTIQKATN